MKDRAVFANQTLSILSENETVMAQVMNNPREQALKGSLPGAVMGAVVRAMSSHKDIAALLLKDQQTMNSYVGFLYEMLKQGKSIEFEALQ